MARADDFVALWNAGDVEAALGTTSPDYTYSDPATNGSVDRAGHVALMRQIYDAIPDRRIEIHRAWLAEGAEFIEYTWRGTSPSGEKIEREYFAVLEFDSEGRATRQRHFAL